MDKKIWVVMLFVALSAQQLMGGSMKRLSFYSACFTEKAPELDGKLSEPEWERAPAYSTYYEYWTPDPGIGKLKTSFKMLYGAKGVYLAIINYEKDMSKVKANYTNRDVPALWEDCCAEIYFDPSGAGIGYTVFTVNSIGTLGDRRQLDTAVSLGEWSGVGWSAATSRNSDNWTVEAFFPWGDLGGTAKEGDLWRFCHVRYSHCSGFLGITSSPGGNYLNAGGFGYLYFGGTTPLDGQAVGRLLSEKVPPPWSFPDGNNMIVCDQKSSFKVENIANLATAEKARAMKLVEEIESLAVAGDPPQAAVLKNAGEIGASVNKCEIVGLPADNLQLAKNLSEQCATLTNLYWSLKTIGLINSTTSIERK
jgi:hypothetical protein